jgi:excisionase family DNA binding protein
MAEIRHQKPGETRGRQGKPVALASLSGRLQGTTHTGCDSNSDAIQGGRGLDLEALRAEPGLIDELAVEDIPALLERCAVERERLAVVERLTHERLRRELATLPGPPDGLLTATEAATMLRVPKSYVLELGRRGDLPRVTLGKYVRFRPADLATYIAAHIDR